jgi:hypothetical protein
MDMTIRAATPAEQLYAHEQSMQIAGQCGSPGYLHGMLDNDGTLFINSWSCNNPSQDTPAFKEEFNQVVDLLRFNGQQGCGLKNRSTMLNFCFDHPEAQVAGSSDYVLRADTKDYSYLIYCSPYSENDHAAIYPYRREYLDRHLQHAEKGIRFITPSYKELFRIPDGDTVRIQRADGTHTDQICRYIDDCHVEVGHGWDSMFHICQFAEQMERCGNTVIPLRSSLPDKCYSVLPSGDEIIIVKKGESGYYHTDKYGHDQAEAQCIVDECNQSGGVTKAQEAAMLAGSMFGWATPAADPKNYNEQGQPIRARQQNKNERDAR